MALGIFPLLCIHHHHSSLELFLFLHRSSVPIREWLFVSSLTIKYDVGLVFSFFSFKESFTKFLSISSLLRGFFFFLNHEWMLNTRECFLCFYWKAHMVFLSLSIQQITLRFFFTLNCSFIPGWTPLCCDIVSFLYITGFYLLTFCWEFLLRISSWEMLVCNFLIMFLSGFGIRIMLVL